MRFRDTIICVLCFSVAGGLLWMGTGRLDNINHQRLALRLVANEPLKNAPPSLAFATVAMGAFRGLVVDILWIRADKLKENGQYFDAKQLADWITTLQPRFPDVWDFQAWNMAYNISVAMPNTQPQERWRWVKNGYELLRDKGIPLNPHSIMLYRSLAWIFHHKIGGITDDVNKYYKLQLYMAMKPLVGDATNEQFEKMAKAPADMAALLQDAEVAALVSELRHADKAFEKDEDFANTYLEYRLVPSGTNSITPIIDKYRQTAAIDKLDTFVKAWILRNVWKMDPAFMDELNRKYGPRDYDDPNKVYPLDWQNPHVHAIYWGAQGLRMDSSDSYRTEEINDDRIIFQSMQSLYRSGKMVVFPLDGGQTYTVFEMPDLRMFETCDKSYRDTLAKYNSMPGKTAMTMEGLRVGHRNFLVNSAFSFYQTGHIRYAQRIFEELRRLFPEEEKYKVTFGEFVKNRMKEEMDLGGMDATNAIEAVVGFLREAYFRYALRDDDAAAGLEAMANEAYDVYMQKYGDEKLTIPGVAGRMDIPDFRTIRFLAITQFLQDEAWPPDLRQALISRIQIERPELLKELDSIYQKLLQQEQEREKAAGAAK
jgi:hypothetical protein